jgi:hypothetical protein
MKKVILILIGLIISSLAFSQVEGYAPVFRQVSLIESKENIWNVSENRTFVANNKTYVLAYEPLNLPIAGNTYRAIVRNKDLYLYRLDSTNWMKASPLIRRDYFHWHSMPNGSSYPDSLRALDTNVNKYNGNCYGTITINPKGIVTIELKTWIWKAGEPEMHPRFSILTLSPKGLNYEFTLTDIVK